MAAFLVSHRRFLVARCPWCSAFFTILLIVTYFTALPHLSFSNPFKAVVADLDVVVVAALLVGWEIVGGRSVPI
eukprot:9569742-Ditylum_brightwellii.AAC.1